jgi:CRP-like cAMP-binding protein
MSTHDHGTDGRAHSIAPFARAAELYGACDNALMDALSPGARALLDRHADEREFGEGTTLWNAGESIGQVYFPLSGMISILVSPGHGSGIEVAAIGRESAAGVGLARDGGHANMRAVVQVRGRFMCLPVHVFTAAQQQSEEIEKAAAAIDRWLLLQAQQTAACNAVHPAEARFCRWLLRASAATASDLIPITQETIGQLLGIRRTTVTLIAQQMQSTGLISYRRGHIALRDRARLEAAACECHAALNRARSHSRSFQMAGPQDVSVHSAAV